MQSVTMKGKGYLGILLGTMWSGKTSEGLRLAFIEATMGLKVVYVNHESDVRSESDYSTHNPLYKEKLTKESGVMMVSLRKLSEFSFTSYDVIIIDEAQFFPDLYSRVIQFVEVLKKRVIVSGLISDFRRQKIGQINDLIPLCDKCDILRTFCTPCSEKGVREVALFTMKKEPDDIILDVGAGDKYVAVCRECYIENH